MRKSIILIVFVIFSISGMSIAQEGGYDYIKETRWGINKNTASGLIGGFIIKHSIAKDDRMFHTFGVEVVNIAHHNEYSLRSRETGSLFKLAKQNYFYAIRAQYGRDLVLFKKAPQQGAQIIAMLAGGPSLGIESPYYLNVSGINVPYDPNKSDHRSVASNNAIRGSGRLLQGIGQSKVILGANIKMGISFEFGVFKNSVTGFELGFLVDAYTRKVIIMDELRSENGSVFPTSFITVFWGSRK